VFAPETGRWLLPSLVALVVAAALLAVGVFPLSLVYVGVLVIAFGYWGFFAAFFRDPERTIGKGIVSPADGKVQEIAREGERVRVAVFMNVTDVHVNRFPIAGRVESIETSGAGFRPAFVPDARHNLQQAYRLSTSLGSVEVVQMTGMVARRLVAFVKAGESHAKGERLGMIVIGSRVDVLLPADRVKVSVEVGERVWAGESTIARERP
jgi:phosphatidylserine decarboxylase